MQNTAQNVDTQIPSNLSDEQMDKFFASGGKEETFATTAPANESAPQEAEQPQEVEAPVQEAKKVEAPQESEQERNYKAAMHEERERRKELQRMYQAQQSQIQKMEERFQQVVERVSTPQVKEPTFEEDPLTALKIEQDRIKRLQYEQVQYDQKRLQTEQMNQSQQQFVNQYRNDAMNYAQSTAKDFKEAYQHLVTSRLSEYKAAGYDDKQANHLLIEDEMAIAVKAYQDGVNPAQRMYELARVRGYQNKPAVVANPPKEEASNNQKENEEKFRQLEKGVNASKSLGAGPGGKVDKGFSLESLAEMEDDDFDRNWTKIVAKNKG